MKSSAILNQDNDIRTKLDPISDDTHLNITQLAVKYGYNVEEHKVITEDGYILSLHRIPCKESSKNNTVIFLMHGVLDSSDSWILQGPNNALGYIFADKGYDVWMGNARGNKYSNSHTTLGSKSSEFWKFSWEEIGVYDLPAMIDYILSITEKEKLYYVGHSQGTTTLFAMLALKPEYNAKINMMFALAPVAWMTNAKSPIFKLFNPAYKIFEYLASSINTYSSIVDIFNNIPKLVCNFLPIGCDNVLEWIIGNDYKFINAELLPVIYGHVPSGSSILQFIHYGQIYQSGRFCRFDYGPSENLAKYGDVLPPDYDLSKVNLPIILFYSTNDWLSDLQDVTQLFAKLPNVYDSYNIEMFNHIDYMYANVAKDLIYSNIIKIIEEFELINDEL
ncbi:jg12214 [Pararge aegeria aegeria]|uniref:Lipase n=1 Tax=Pararge aegeria aegeria TaxID=348720 RepID=A0A8S4SE17_9NEOP|nr:jg12214 [Pararge aegeria aegeria]